MARQFAADASTEPYRVVQRLVAIVGGSSGTSSSSSSGAAGNAPVPMAARVFAAASLANLFAASGSGTVSASLAKMPQFDAIAAAAMTCLRSHRAQRMRCDAWDPYRRPL
jgi:hypothetical protein